LGLVLGVRGDDTVDTPNGGGALACVRLADAAAIPACLATAPLAARGDGAAALEEALLLGRFPAASHLLAMSRHEGLDLSTTLHQVSTQIRKALQNLADEQEKESKDEPVIAAFEWAQSVTTLYLNVKFSHKMDAPVTLGCEASAPVFSARAGTPARNDTGLDYVEFSAACKAKRKRFVLRLPLSHAVLPEASTWLAASVGRATLTLRKAEDGPWARLLRDGATKQSRTWWTMQGRGCHG